MKKMLLTIAVLGLLAPWSAAAGPRPYTRNVAIVVYENAEPLDWTGPFEVYNDAGRFGSAGDTPAFNVYIVSKTTEPLDAQGLKVVPSYSIENAPKPDIVLFPGGPASHVYDDPAFFAWARKAAEEAEIAQSVCTGAFVLGKAGLLDGLEVTTHYASIDLLGRTYPKAMVKNGRRYVDNGHVVTTAGISAGIDGSLHVVARLLGRRVADQVASYMEYHWTPEAFLSASYSYLNPSADARGRLMQTGEMQLEGKSFAEAEKTFRGLLKDDPQDRDAWTNLGTTLAGVKDHVGAAQAIARGVDGTHSGYTPYGYYHAAVEYARADHADEAVAMLQQAFAAGYPHRDAVDHDPDLAKLRSDPRARPMAASR